jgi:hypothetical protein
MSFLRCNLIALVALALAVPGGPAEAQLNGHNTLGDFGLMSGSQPAPGLYASAFYYNYHADRLINKDGDRVTLSPGEPGDITINAFAGFLWWVSNTKIFGANYGVMAVVPFSNATLEAPIFGLEQGSGTGFGDLYVQPVNLGWQTPQADFTAGIGVFMPTGKYEADADDNSGLGMWSFELYAGGTVYFDKARTWHFATTAFFETHTEKKDTDIRVGDMLSLEGGLGKSFKDGLLSVGAAYYAQWKISSDDLGVSIAPPMGRSIGKHNVFGVGPEVTLPILAKKKLIATINARYLWETGARSKTQGNTLAVTATFPIPSIPME